MDGQMAVCYGLLEYATQAIDSGVNMICKIRSKSSLGIRCRLRRKGTWDRKMDRDTKRLEDEALAGQRLSADGKWMNDYMSWFIRKVSRLISYVFSTATQVIV